MPTPSLSYVLTTRNKLPYLKHVLASLIEAKQPGEEILVADGASTDGTAEYLAELHAGGMIDFFVSEPDAGESHGFNKLLLKAQGELIKIVTDDDAFHATGIQACKDFMLTHPEIDLLNTDGLKRSKRGDTYPSAPLAYAAEYEIWKQIHRPFSSCGLGIMIRRSSLPLVGLFDPSFVRADAEYTLRVTAGKAKVAWYAAPCYARLLNPHSNTHTQAKRYFAEGERLDAYYFGRSVSLRGRLKKILSPFLPTRAPETGDTFAFEEWEEMYRTSLTLLDEHAPSPRDFHTA